METCSGKGRGHGVNGNKASAKIYGTELGAKTCGTELGARICGAEVPAMSRLRGCRAGGLPRPRRHDLWC